MEQSSEPGRRAAPGAARWLRGALGSGRCARRLGGGCGCEGAGGQPACPAALPLVLPYLCPRYRAAPALTAPHLWPPSRRQYNLLSGDSITADLYVSAMPVDIVKKLMPAPWYQMDFFK